MAAPVVENQTGDVITTNSDPLLLTYPTGITGDSDEILLAGASIDGAPGVVWPGSWVELDEIVPGTNAMTLALGYLDTSGSESGTFDLDLGGSEQACWWVLRITGWHGTTVPEIQSATGNSTAPDAPSLTPSWGAEENLWLAVFGSNGGNNLHTGAPANYIDVLSAQRTATAGGTLARTVRRSLNAASENPDAFGINTAQDWAAASIAVRGAIGGASAFDVTAFTASRRIAITSM